MNTVAEFLRSVKPKVRSNPSQSFRLTSATLYGLDTLHSTKEFVTSFLADFHASRFPMPEDEPEPMTSETCGLPPSSAFASYDRGTFFSKMCQDSFPFEEEKKEGCDTTGEYSGTWPRAGILFDGVCYRHKKSERRISETGSGLWPTPTAQDSKNDGAPSQMSSNSLPLNAAVKVWPTPTVNMVSGGPNHNSDAVNERGHGINLAGAVHKFATPQSRDFRTGEAHRWDDPNRSQNLNDQIGGKLNPGFVEWLMNWPIGWTSLEPMPAENFQRWLEADWWVEEFPEVPRLVDSLENRVPRLRALGNGQVPLCAAVAWQLLTNRT